MHSKHLLMAAFLFISAAAFAQDKKKPDAAPEQAKEEAAAQASEEAAKKEMEAWTAYMTPGAMHKMLASASGDWRQEVTMWMDPAAPPTKSEAHCSTRMIMGDRFQESVTEGNMMGMPFNGRSIVGYDNAKKIFQSTWIDNMGTGIMYTEGPYDPKTNSITLTGTSVDPVTGKSEKVKEIMKFIDDNTQMMEMYKLVGGKEIKVMEIKFTRQ